MSNITAISPIDGRYYSKTEELTYYFSEAALMQYRVLVEVEYFIALVKLPLPQLSGLKDADFESLRLIYEDFSENDALAIKELEKRTNHDVKAVEYFIKDKFDDLGFEKYKEFIHFGLTSQDINNTSFPLMIKNATQEVYKPLLSELLELLGSLSTTWKNIPMLARTHGQPASPTSLGKEIMVFIERLEEQLDQMSRLSIDAKFGGATGNFNAHKAAYPNIDWKKFANNFIGDVLDLKRQQTTTQIEHYDNLAALFNCMSRINVILIDFCRDIWTYISMDYFKQKIIANEVGSSAMPHKVNPIDFENAEGNLGLANAIFDHLASKLPISRLQRDLTDSTVLRNIGVPISHTVISLKSIMKGISKLVLNEDKIKADLEANWAVVAEAIQTVLRREGYPEPYEALKNLTRRNSVTNKASVSEFIDSLEVSNEIKKELKQFSPSNYLGYN
ncbi:MAG: adenylosuccinate lyase [Sphingobacteriales bacterium]|jgi:adenylosuccinate lyase